VVDIVAGSEVYMGLINVIGHIIIPPDGGNLGRTAQRLTPAALAAEG
jgi:hypothetical protein